MKKQVKLYNVLFPLWMLLLFPQMWLIVLPGNFIIDSLVLIISMKILGFTEKKSFYKKNIFIIFGMGLFADFVGAIFLLIMTMLLEIGTMGDELYMTLPAVFISAILIYILDYFASFKTCDKKTRIKMSLIFAIVTAPYTFLIPSSLLYGF